ncbi:MAG: DUF1934 domain-containing protein [Ligilactobacillus agilis]|nr:DUF1934 domain-containing protein [Ligilactobacillus agilis]
MAELSNGIPVTIHVVTQNIQDNQVVDYDEVFEGQFFQMGASIYLRYQEIAEQEALVTFKITANGEVQLTRKTDEMNLRLYFVAGKQVNAKYVTPYGVVPVTSRTSKLQAEVDDTLRGIIGQINIDYTLNSGKQLLGRYKIRLQFKG